MNEHLRDRILRKLETLSDERGYQVLDYVEFIESRYAEREVPTASTFTRFTEAIEDKLRKDGIKEGGWSISRFKGLGEMNAEQLWETTMNPDTRRLLPVSLGDFDQAASEHRFNMLMGKGEAAARRAWLEEHGNEAEADI